MYWKRLTCFIGIAFLMAGFSSAVFASGDNHRTEVTVQAPLDAVNCAAAPATISVLGLPMDISNADLGIDRSRKHHPSLTCADLTVGRTVEVKLSTDIPDTATSLLTATAVAVQGKGNTGVKVAAPLQALDPAGANVTVLGLVVDITTATLLNDKKHPVTVSQLAVGQFAGVTIASNQAPLVATKLQVRINQVKVQAPLDAVDCAAVPATINLLGLTIDVSKATFGPTWHKSGVVTCANLAAGQVVEAYLTGDTPDGTGRFAATEVDMRGHREDDVIIAAPLQAVDPAGANVTVLSLVVDIAGATLLNDEEDPITASQLKMGQFGKLELSSNQAPLVADELQVNIRQIKIRGPLEAVNCAASPATINVLGLTIDVSNAKFGPEERRGHHPGLTCANLVVGRMAEVELISDVPGAQTNLLTATRVNRGGFNTAVKIAAPLEAIDPAGSNVTVLGVVVDITTATLVDDNKRPITPAKLAVGQFVFLDLAGSQAPFSATLLVAETGINPLHVRVMDEKGKPVNDPAADVKVEVAVTIGKTVLKVGTTGTGTFRLTGLPAGKAKITVTRVNNGKTGTATASFKVKAGAVNSLTLRLKTVK